MAKFKVGDRVKAKDPIWGYRKGTVKEIIDDPALKKSYTIDFDDGTSYAVASDAVSASNSAVRSTNAAVQEELNSACARNERFKKGDLVKMTRNDPSNRVWRIDEDYKDGSIALWRQLDA
jgi:hypothetical protein